MNKLMTHMVCGYPNIEESEKIFKTLSEYSEYLEVQFPFSDPIADGPVIEKANEIALKNGITTEKCFNFIEKNINRQILRPVSSTQYLSTETGLKILIMTYYNIILNYGIEKFIKKAKSVGVYGFIIPDVPFDEDDGKNIRELCKKHNIVFTEIVSPITTNSRLEEINKLNPGLIYAISQNMTTGSKAKFGTEFEKYINNLKHIFISPFGREYLKGERGVSIGVGFGVKTKQDVEKVCNISDFSVIGSEFIKRHNSGGISELEKYLKEIIK